MSGIRRDPILCPNLENNPQTISNKLLETETQLNCKCVRICHNLLKLGTHFNLVY